ncbi:copper oxidase [Saccharopolyspora erythraea]|uniref:copper oxidase n=1 Tax=Saccharopolyspora erythraea TaxID=1836 RepID=UPI0020119940|nr:copper oxidase [Saccharopolyspora erythraea]
MTRCARDSSAERIACHRMGNICPKCATRFHLIGETCGERAFTRDLPFFPFAVDHAVLYFPSFDSFERCRRKTARPEPLAFRLERSADRACAEFSGRARRSPTAPGSHGTERKFMSAESPPGSRKRRRVFKTSVSLVIAAASAGTAAAVPAQAQTPVGVGPLPITFDIKDDNGKWYDSGLNLFGSQSLAIAELPRLGTVTGGGAGGGALSANQVQSLTNSNIAAPLTGLVKGATSPVPKLGETGVSLLDSLNLDSTLASVRSIGTSQPEAKADAAKAEGLIGEFSRQVASMPADQPINLAELPVGVDLQGVLNDLQRFALKGPPVTVNFRVDPAKSEGLRDPFALIAPEGAKGYPFDDAKGGFFGEQSIQLTEPGLYAFADRISPYMLGAVVVDDPLTIGLDFGKNLQVNSHGLTVPSNADIVQRLVNTFFNITNPNNWQRFKPGEETTWNPIQPPAPILQYDAAGKPVLIPNLDAYFDKKFMYPKTLKPGDKAPPTPGVGEVWIDTEMEEWAGKNKVGSATKINAENWSVERKIGAPGIDMNNPHNMWTDKNYKYLYQSEWFDDKVDVFDRETGRFIRQTQVGHNPAHVMTKPGTDELVVGLNAGNEIVELAPGGTHVTRRITVSPSGEIRHPHAHWTSADGKTVITPNTLTNNASVVDMESGKVRTEQTGQLPIATSMTPDNAKAYTADFLGQSITCISLAENACDKDGEKVHSKPIDLWENYNPLTGPKQGKPFGGLMIQLPVSPDGKALLGANVLSTTVSVVDPKTDKVVKDLPCTAGCHGINFGAKQGGGYYGYVSNKFSNVIQIIDVDPNGDGNIEDAAVVGQKTMDATAETKMDGTITGQSGMGGQGVLPVPLVYNGWAQQNQGKWREMLTCEQLNPITPGAC